MQALLVLGLLLCGGLRRPRPFRPLLVRPLPGSIVSFLIKDEEAGDNEDVLGEGDEVHNPDDDLVRIRSQQMD